MSLCVGFSGESTLKPIVHSIAFAGVTALAEGLKVAEVVAAAEVQRDDVVYCEVLLGGAALALVSVRNQDSGRLIDIDTKALIVSDNQFDQNLWIGGSSYGAPQEFARSFTALQDLPW